MWGIDRLSGGRHSFARKRLRNSTTAVLTHNAALDRRGRSTLEVLDELGVVPSILFSPEHGLDGAAQAEEPVPSQQHRPSPLDENSGVPSDRGQPNVISLYGTDLESLTPQDVHFSGISNLVIDLVDVGSRYYTYVWTALLAARKAASLGVHTVILDRPNPLGSDPSSLEGKPQAEGFLSFVGMAPIAIRHGLTIGEVLTHCLAREGLTPGPDGAFSLVACKGWERYKSQLAWGRPFIPPSPNMPTLETAQLYPGACLVEGTNLSEGRGTSFPFRAVGSPFLDGSKLARDLEGLHLPGILFRPIAFKPSFEKHAGKLCQGVMLHITNPQSFRPVMTYLSLITLARAQAPEQFAFRTDAYEFERERLAFDLLTGSTAAREAILAGASPNEVSELVCPVGPEVTGLFESLEPDLARATAQPSGAGGHGSASHVHAAPSAPLSEALPAEALPEPQAHEEQLDDPPRPQNTPRRNRQRPNAQAADAQAADAQAADAQAADAQAADAQAADAQAAEIQTPPDVAPNDEDSKDQAEPHDPDDDDDDDVSPDSE